jgi:hypothetical protein
LYTALLWIKTQRRPTRDHVLLLNALTHINLEVTAIALSTVTVLLTAIGLIITAHVHERGHKTDKGDQVYPELSGKE